MYTTLLALRLLVINPSSATWNPPFVCWKLRHCVVINNVEALLHDSYVPLLADKYPRPTTSGFSLGMRSPLSPPMRRTAHLMGSLHHETALRPPSVLAYHGGYSTPDTLRTLALRYEGSLARGIVVATPISAA